jgi:tape measure domain-containing protein
MSSFSKSVNRLSSSLGGLITKLGLVGGAATAGLAVFSIKAAADLESTTVAFRTLMRDAVKGDKMVAKLFDFSKKTPFEPTEVFGAGRQLLAAGFEEGEVIERVRMLGDIAAGSQTKLDELTAAFAQVGATGRADLGDINKIANRGIPLYAALAEQMGVTKGEIRDLAMDGKIGLAELEGAMRLMTGEGGVFFEAMSEQSKTLNGLWSTLKGNVKAGAAEIGKSLVHATNFKGILRAVNAELETFDWKAFGEAAGDAFRVILVGTQSAIIGLGALLKAKNQVQSGLLTLVEQFLLNQADSPGSPTRESDMAAIRDTFAAKRGEVESKGRRTEALFAQLNSTLEAAIKASEAPPPALIDFEQIEAERVKTLRHDKPMPETPSDGRVVGLLDKILAELKNPKITVQRAS